MRVKTLRRWLGWSIIVAFVLLSGIAFFSARAPLSYAPPPQEPIDQAYCAANNITEATCNRVIAYIALARKGQATLSAPDIMHEGAKARVHLAINRGTGPVPAEASAETQTGAPRPLDVYPKMSATLSGVGFDVDPIGQQQRTLGVTGVAVWDWTVSAQHNDVHSLSVSIYADLPTGDAGDTELLTTLDRTVDVKVPWTAALLKLITSLSSIATALAAFIPVASAAWLALVAFGRKPVPNNPAGG